MPFSQIIPPSLSPTESKSLFFTSVSLLLSRIQGYHCHRSKFHIYVLVYCYWCFSFWLTSLCIIGSSFIHLIRTDSKKKLQIELPYDPEIPLLGINTEETRIERDTCTPMFITALFIITRTWKQPRCPVLLPGKSHGWRSLVGCCLWGCTGSDTTEGYQISQS